MYFIVTTGKLLHYVFGYSAVLRIQNWKDETFGGGGLEGNIVLCWTRHKVKKERSPWDHCYISQRKKNFIVFCHVLQSQLFILTKVLTWTVYRFYTSWAYACRHCGIFLFVQKAPHVHEEEEEEFSLNFLFVLIFCLNADSQSCFRLFFFSFLF